MSAANIFWRIVATGLLAVAATLIEGGVAQSLGCLALLTGIWWRPVRKAAALIAVVAVVALVPAPVSADPADGVTQSQRRVLPNRAAAHSHRSIRYGAANTGAPSPGGAK